MSKQDIILNILKSEGMDPRAMQMREVYDAPSYFAQQIDKAAAGEVVYFDVKCENLGRCYNKYHTVQVNHSDKARKPVSNWGNVEPKWVKEIEGFQCARFEYAVDSSD